MTDVNCGFDGADGDRLLHRLGPHLRVNIGYDPAFDALQPRRAPTPLVSGVEALIDTGSSATCIDSTIAADHGLPIVHQVQMAGAGGIGLFSMAGRLTPSTGSCGLPLHMLYILCLPCRASVRAHLRIK